MTPDEVLRRARSKGIRLRVTSDFHIAADPSDRLTDELREAIRSQKWELIEALRNPPLPKHPCPECGSPDYCRAMEADWECLNCTELASEYQIQWVFGPTKWLEDGDRP